MDFSQIKDIQIDGKKVMIIFPKAAASGTQYLWRRHPEYPYLTFARCWKRTEIGDEKNVSGTHIREGMQFCFGFTDRNKLLVPLDPDTSEKLNWSDWSDMYTEIINSQTARHPNDVDTGSGYQIIMSDYTNVLGSKINYEHTFRAYGVKDETDHINFYNRIQATKQYRDMGGNLTYTGTTYHDMKEWEISDAEWSVTTTVNERMPLTTASIEPSANFTIARYIEYAPRNVSFQKGDLKYWPTSYYNGYYYPSTTRFSAIGTPLITLDGKKGATKVLSARNNFLDYRVFLTSNYLRAFMKIDCKSNSLGINETWGLYVGVTLKK